MMAKTINAALLLALSTTLVSAQYGPPSGSGSGSNSGNNPYSSSGGSSSNSGSSSSSSHFGPPSQYTTMITAHAVLATLAFGLLFPVGGIMIRLASFPGLWWVHGLFQTVAYILYIAAFALGVIMATHMRMLHLAHPIIGIVLFALLIFQPVLGFLHHVMFKKHSRRVVWSYGHIWLGRIVITVGVINGGLGLQLAQRTYVFAPGRGTIVAYAVLAGLVWVVYMASAVYGEVKRRRAAKATSAKGEINTPPGYEGGKEERGQYA